MKRLLLMLSLVVGLASTALAVDQVVFVAQGASYDGTATKVTIPTGEITNKTFTAEGVCSVSHEKKNNSSSQVMSNLVRWYANDVMTITPVEGVSISKIEINCSEAKYSKVFETVTVNGNKNFTVSGTVASYEPSEAITSGFSFAPTAQVRFSSIVISYVRKVITEAPELPVVKFSDVTAENNGEYEVVEGTEVSVTSVGADYLLVTNTTDLTEEKIEGSTYSFAVNADDMWEFTGVNEFGSSEKFTVTFTAVPAGAVVYTLVKSASELVAGETYAIACADKNMAMSNAIEENFRPQTGVEIVNGKFEANNSILAFTLEGEAGNWNMKTVNYGNDANGNGYFDLSSTAKNNYLVVTDTPRAWSITIDDSNNAVIKSALNATTTRYIKYNASATRFATYTSGQADVQLYREEVVAPAIYLNGEQLQAGATPELKAGDKIVIRGHEANELHYKMLNSAMRAPSANLDGWFKHDSNEYEYEVPEGFENESISLAAKAVNNGKESAPVQFVVSEGTMTGVAGVEAEATEAQTEWFTLQGVRVAAPAEGGLYIRRQGSKVEKVVL